jgi:predicted O-linked N-acetylglucosamine transferase (SPINDLY family)
MEFQKEWDRALAVHRQGKLREALHRYDAILKADPAHAQALHYSGIVLYQAGHHAAAVERIRAALAIDRTSAEAWSNLALALEAQGRASEALRAQREAVRHAPQDAGPWANLAATELTRGLAADAEQSARRSTTIDASHAPGWYNLALALEAQGRVLEALDAVGRASALAPHDESAAGLKASLERSLGAGQRAIQTLRGALARVPMSATLHFELAGLLDRQGDAAGAIDEYRQTLRLEPAHGAALSQLLFALRRCADWSGMDELERTFLDGVGRGQRLLSPFVLLAQPGTRAAQRQCAESFCRALVGPPLRMRRELPERRLRIGYLSGDFRVHATALLAAGLFERHDRARFEVFGYSMGPDDGSPIRERIKRAFDRFVDLHGHGADRVAQAIRADGIDILVDLKGHTAGAPHRALALRPAPIQVHYLGYPGTLGGGLVDYLVGDSVVTPPAHAPDYAETLVRLPGSYQINDRERPIVEPPPRAALGLPDDAVVLCCFNAAWKIRPAAMDAWATILEAVPDAILWLLARGDDDPAVANLRREAAARGIDARRLVFAMARPNPEYLGLYRHADLFLDTWPYNAHTTGSDALWAGCPVLTLSGDTFAGRVGESLARAVALPELVTRDVDAYVARAIALASDRSELARLRAFLEGPGHHSALFDTARTTRALEAAFAAMADQYRRGTREPIDVAPD